MWRREHHERGGVALRKESVDRNPAKRNQLRGYKVALRKESVDRNGCQPVILCNMLVALRKESVDRNQISGMQDSQQLRSLSARRAWIEIGVLDVWALRLACRSPQGERG